MTKKRHSPGQALSTASSTRRVLRGQFHGSSTPLPAPRGRTARRSVPTSEVIGLHLGFLPQIQPRLSTSEVGRFLRKRRYGEHDKEAPLSRARTLDGQFHEASTTRPVPRLQYPAASTTGTDRSEIGPYLGDPRSTSRVPATNSASPTPTITATHLAKTHTGSCNRTPRAPSTASVAPVKKPAPSDASHTAARATSSGCPIRPAG